MRALRVTLCCLVALCVGATLPARAQTSETPYQLHPALDATVMGVSGATWLVPSLFLSSFVAADGCECRAARLNALDRPYAGRYDGGFSIAGEALIASVYTAVVLLDLFDVVKADEPFDSFLVDLAVLAETLLVNGAVNQLVKISVARPRPLLYGRDPSDQLLHAPERYLSFYSAHTSSSFSVGLAYAQTFAYRHPDSPYRFLVYAGAVLMGGIIGATRIAAGQHFPTDVLAGAVAGTAFGLVIPWLHRRTPHARVSMTATPQSFGLTLAIDSL